MIRPRPSPRAFTLLELMIVLLILAAVAAGAASMVGEADEQFRFEETRSRVERIRRAVIGGADGTPKQIAGFAADMGRLPTSLRELVVAPDSPAPWTVDATGVGAGWRGPYLHALPSLTGAQEFFDGWGNSPATTTPGPQGPENYGWRLLAPSPPPAAAFTLQSLGRDRQIGGATQYDLDYPPAAPPLIRQDDIYIDLNGLTVTVQNDGATVSETLRLRIHTAVNGVVTTLDSDPTAAALALPQNVAVPVSVTFPAAAQWTTWGLRAVEVQRDNAGSWEALGGQAAIRLELRPRASNAVTWRIP